VPNPFRSEREAFRTLVAFAIGGAIVIGVALAAEPVHGVVVGAALLGFGAGKIWSDFRHWQAEGAAQEEGPPG
jgi:hypothetical protein